MVHIRFWFMLIQNIKKKTEAFLVTSKIHLKVWAEKSKDIFMSCAQQNTGQYHNTKLCNTSSKSDAKFKYSRTTLTNQNCVCEEIKITVSLGNAHYPSFQNL
jgi:hypothetical protein